MAELDKAQPNHIEVKDEPGRNSFDSVERQAIGGKDVSELPDHYYRNPKFIGSALGFILGYEAGFLSYVMVAQALLIINADIGPSPDIVWVLLSVTLGQSIAFPIVGRLSDIFGRRWFFIGGNLLAFVGYIVGGRAKNISVLIGADILVGLGSAIQIAGSAIPGELLPNKHRFLGFVVIVGGLGPLTAMGPGIGIKWRWIFYFMAILTFSAVVLLFFCYHPPKFHNLHKHSSKRDTIKGLDYIGLVMYAGSCASLLLGISWGGQRYPWRSAQVIVTIVVGGIGLIAFAFWELHGRMRHPLMPLRLLFRRNYIMLTICSCVGSMVFYALSILWPQQLTALFGLSGDTVGWASCTLPGGVLLGWFISGGLVGWAKFVRVKYQLIFCTALFTAFIGAMASADGRSLGQGIALSLIGASGIGLLETICIAGAPLHLDAKDIGLANGVQYSLRTITSSLSNSIYVTILNNKVASNLPKYVIPAAMNAGLSESSAIALVTAIATGNVSVADNVPGVTAQILQAASAAAHTAYFKSFQVVYYASIAFGACAIISAICVNGRLMESKMTSEIARKLQGSHIEELDVERLPEKQEG